MGDSRYEQLHEFLERKAGSAYRTAFRYDADSWETIYIREDLATRTLKDALPTIIQRVRETEPWVDEGDYPEFGSRTGAVEIHEDGVLLHFDDRDGGGVIVSLDPEAARSLTSFLTECESILR